MKYFIFKSIHITQFYGFRKHVCSSEFFLLKLDLDSYNYFSFQLVDLNVIEYYKRKELMVIHEVLFNILAGSSMPLIIGNIIMLPGVLILIFEY